MSSFDWMLPLSGYRLMDDSQKIRAVARACSCMRTIANACSFYYLNKDRESDGRPKMSASNADVCIATIYVLACNGLGEPPEPGALGFATVLNRGVSHGE